MVGQQVRDGADVGCVEEAGEDVAGFVLRIFGREPFLRLISLVLA